MRKRTEPLVDASRPTRQHAFLTWPSVVGLALASVLFNASRASAVPISQPPSAPAPATDETPTPSMRPPPALNAGAGQHADNDAPPRPIAPGATPSAPNTHLGVGYKIGNGLGFLGADLIASPLPHVVIDFQVNTFDVSTPNGGASGYGLAPTLQLFFNDPGRSTGYLSAGWVHAAASLQDVHASVNGFIANLGYEWKWPSGIGILLGGGLSALGKVTATNGVDTISINGGVHPNIEAGLRLMFI